MRSSLSREFSLEVMGTNGLSMVINGGLSMVDSWEFMIIDGEKNNVSEGDLPGEVIVVEAMAHFPLPCHITRW